MSAKPFVFYAKRTPSLFWEENREGEGEGEAIPDATSGPSMSNSYDDEMLREILA